MAYDSETLAQYVATTKIQTAEEFKRLWLWVSGECAATLVIGVIVSYFITNHALSEGVMIGAAVWTIVFALRGSTFLIRQAIYTLHAQTEWCNLRKLDRLQKIESGPHS